MLKETRWQAKYIAEFFQFYAGCADKISGETLPIDKPDMFVFTKREPLGRCGRCGAVEFAAVFGGGQDWSGFGGGQYGGVKSLRARQSAAMLEFGNLIEEAGFPPGVVNIVTGHGDPCGAVLTGHPIVARMSFTGGPGAARHVL